MEFSFYAPVQVVFGKPVATALPEVLAGMGVERVVVLSDAGLAEIGLTGQVADLVRAGGWQVTTFSQVQSNPTVGDVEAALQTAAAIGDDRLQTMSRGTVAPESFTHGTSKQRAKWFRRGYERGQPEACDTFSGAI